MAKGRGKNAPDKAELANVVTNQESQALAVPGDLSPYAQEEWLRVTTNFVGLSILNDIDYTLMREHCIWTDLARQCEDAIYTDGACAILTQEDAYGNVKTNQAITLKKQATEMILAIDKQLGLTPLSRSKMNLNNATTAYMITGIHDRMTELARNSPRS